MTTITLTDAAKRTYTLTTEHAASSYGQPVLIGPDGLAYGPHDLMRDRYGEYRAAGDIFSDSLFLIDPADQDCDLIKKWNRL